MSSRVTSKPPTLWRRPRTRTYDYNMQLGENYYKPQLDYIESRRGRGKTPPSATTFAERLLKFPPGHRSSSATRRADEEASSFSSRASAATQEGQSYGRYASLDDLGLDEDLMRRRKQLLQASQENLTERGVSPAAASGKGLRVTFGDKMLDAIGVKETAAGSSASQRSELFGDDGDAIDKILAERRNRRQQQQQGSMLSIKSAEADLFTEDPMKSPGISSRLQQARREMDEMRDGMRVDNDMSASSRFRQRLRAKREREAREEAQDNQFFGGSLSSLNEVGGSMSPQISTASKARQFLAESSGSSLGDRSAGISNSGRSVSMQQMKVSSVSSKQSSSMFDDDDSETMALLNKVDQIRKRAKERLAQITDDDFPDLQIGSSLASRRAVNRQQDFDDDFESSGGSRSMAISKRSVRSSYDIE